MNEQQPNYERYLPGDEVRLKVQLRHHRVHLRTVDAVFRMAQGSEEAELRAEDEGVRTISTQVTLEGRGIGFQSEAELSMRIQRWTPPASTSWPRSWSRPTGASRSATKRMRRTWANSVSRWSRSQTRSRPSW
jgi:hypothetical protein